MNCVANPIFNIFTICLWSVGRVLLKVLSVLLKEKEINLKPPNTGQNIVCLGKNTTSVYEMCFSSGKLKVSEEY